MRVIRAVLFLAVAACGEPDAPQSRVVGQIWNDANGNGVRDPDEAPLPGITVHINFDSDPSINFGEPVARTDDDGRYELFVPGPGTYDIRTVMPFGFRAEQRSKRRRPANIIGGRDAAAGEYPFMVSVGLDFDGATFPLCGGALITDRHVVTAAHCSGIASFVPAVVIAGSLEQLGGEVIAVESVLSHPNFDSDPAHGYDIAVWTLAEPVSLETLRTVELLTPDTAALAVADVLATTIGWGTSDRDSTRLQQVHVPLVSPEACAPAYPEATNFETQICAGFRDGGIDSCQGDSGGPLLVRDTTRQVWVHAGVVSYGNGCALRDSPGVYARTSELSEWVMDHALEKSDTLRFTVADASDVTTIDFPARVTTRPLVGDIAPRWQLAGITLPETFSADVPITARWTLLADDPSLTGFTCTFVPDLAAGAPAQAVPCNLGANELAIPAGYPDGVYATDLTATRNEVTYTQRATVIAGFPTTTISSGGLDAGDPINPDFGQGHIDYFEITGLSGTRAVAIELDSGVGLFLALYDRDLHDPGMGGGLIRFSEPASSGKERLVIVPDGRNYLIGVTTFDDAALGSYSISILNDGTLMPR